MLKCFFQALYFLFLSLLAVLPVYRLHFLLGPAPDSFYYYARTNAVLKGFWQIGNPFYFEHRNDMAVSFFIPDWLSAIPGSFVIWPLINALLIYLLIKNLGVKGPKLYFGTAFCYISVLLLIVRPTSLQTIMPFFLIFSLALVRYLKSSKNLILLLVSSTLTFYIYPYLYLIVTVSIGLLILLKKGSRWFLLIPVFASPAVVYYWQQIHSPYYWETMQRIGLIFTHIPTFDTFSYFLILTLPMVFLRKNLAFMILYLAITAVLFSPIITGKELELSGHVVRFIAIFGALAIVTLINKSNRFIFLAVIWLVLFYKNYSLLGLIINPPLLPKVEIPAIANQGKVIKARGLLNDYIPFMTNSYVLFHPEGLLHLMSSDEALERYLVWKYPEKIDVNVLLTDFRSFMGTGRGIEVVDHHNYHVRICRLLRLSSCGNIETVYSYYGSIFFQTIIDRYYQEVFPNIDHYYQKYHVDYVID